MENENEQLSQFDMLEEHEDELFSTPVEILSEFLSTLMARNYKSALYYCKLILQYEPENKVVQDFYPLIKGKLNSDAAYESDENMSEASTEYFTSTSVTSANTSISSSFSSDEEEIPPQYSE